MVAEDEGSEARSQAMVRKILDFEVVAEGIKESTQHLKFVELNCINQRTLNEGLQRLP
jgi:hypothetical protein